MGEEAELGKRKKWLNEPVSRGGMNEQSVHCVRFVHQCKNYISYWIESGPTLQQLEKLCVTVLIDKERSWTDNMTRCCLEKVATCAVSFAWRYTSIASEPSAACTLFYSLYLILVGAVVLTYTGAGTWAICGLWLGVTAVHAGTAADVDNCLCWRLCCVVFDYA